MSILCQILTLCQWSAKNGSGFILCICFDSVELSHWRHKRCVCTSLNVNACIACSVPTRTGKIGRMGLEKWEGIFQSMKSQGIWKRLESQRKSHKILENLGKFRQMLFVIFKWTVCYLLKWIKFSVYKNKTLKKYWKMDKNTGKVREFCQCGKVETAVETINLR